MNSAWLIRRTAKALLRVRPRPTIIARQQIGASLSTAAFQQQDDSRSWWMGAVGLAVASTASASVAACEEKATPPVVEGETKQEEEEVSPDDEDTIGPDDPYYNIPEEDEPTDCSMCKTFRQGPCRLDWKRFELCVKDNDTKTPPQKDGEAATAPKEVSDPTACMKYAMPFYQCSSNHVNTYLMIDLEQTQKTVIEPMMETYNAEEAQSRRLCYTKDALVLDWTHWEKFVTTLHDLGGHVPTKYETDKEKPQSPADALRATWNDKEGNQYLMMNPEGEPFLITVTTHVPKLNADSENEPGLFMTFALDQHGNLMGDARNSEHEHFKEPEEGKEKEPTTTHVPLQMQIVPGVSQEITIYGLYVPKDGDFLEDGILYESKPYKLKTITKKALKKAKKLAKQKSSKSSSTSTTEAKKDQP